MLLMSLRAKLSHVNNGVEVERGVRTQQRGGGQEWIERYELQKWFSGSMLHCIYLT